MITLLDYGVGNIASIINMIKKVGGEVRSCSSPVGLREAKKIILPGVGAFDHGMKLLHDGGWIEELNDAVLVRNLPVLGICLGMHLMCRTSEEGELPGLGWVDAEVRRFDLLVGGELKIPHMGWSSIEVIKPNPLVAVDQDKQRFYFVHSYHVVCKQAIDILAVAHHGYDFTASFSHNNIFGTQFHPEKSHKFGMALMKKFVELPC